MKVTFLLPGYAPSPVGGVRVVYEYANGLAGRGHTVTVLHPRFERPLGAPSDYRAAQALPRAVLRLRDRLLGVPVSWHDVDPRVSMRFVPTLDQRHVPDADAVVATAWNTAHRVLSYPARTGRKFYLLQHFEDWAGPEADVAETWRYPLQKIVIARWLEEKGRQLNVPAEQMRYIPNGLDHAKFRVVRSIEGRSKRVAMMYHRLPWKGAADGISALSAARARHPDLTAVLFGVDERPADLPSWIEYHQDPSQDVLVADIYNASSVYLCPSWQEGWHLPPAEAMACGCALVSTDIPGVADYAVLDRTARLAPARHPAALGDTLASLLSDDAQRLRLAQNGLLHIQQFTWARATASLEQYLASEPV
jgi:L-malate glycosyltransferase